MKSSVWLSSGVKVSPTLTSPTGGLISGRGAEVTSTVLGLKYRKACLVRGPVVVPRWQEKPYGDLATFRLAFEFKALSKEPGFYEKGNFDQLRFRREVILGCNLFWNESIPLMVRAANERDIRNLIALKKKKT